MQNSERDHSFGTFFYFLSISKSGGNSRRWQCFDAYSRVCMSLGVPWPMSRFTEPKTHWRWWFTEARCDICCSPSTIICWACATRKSEMGHLESLHEKLARCEFRMYSRWWRWVRAKLQQFFPLAILFQKIERSSAVVMDLDALKVWCNPILPMWAWFSPWFSRWMSMFFFDVISLGEGVSKDAKNVVLCLVEDVSRSFKIFQTVKR